MDRKTIGRYEILDELGRGAMGSVFRARDPAVGRTVALKCILSGALAGDQTNEFRERFYREARAAGALAHPGIVPVFDVGDDKGVPFLVMELVQGRTLSDALKQGERFPLERVCEIGEQIAQALGYAHRNGVVHRDIKPANILMTSREVYGAERPRITDFGVAKLADTEITTTGQILGTPAFMAPEQFTGASIDGRADLFSLGVILYRMATGEQPFFGENITTVSYKIVHTDPIPPTQLNPAIGARFEAVLLKCLAKSPTIRYQTGDELAADLANVRTGAHTHAPHPLIGQGFNVRPSFDANAPQSPGRSSGQRPQWSLAPGNLPSSPMRPSTASAATPVAAVRNVSAPVQPAARSAPASALAASPGMMATAGTEPARSTALEDAAEEELVSAEQTAPIPTMRSGRIARPVPNKKKGFPILPWVILGVLGIVATRYLLQSRVQQALLRASDPNHATAPARPEPVLGSPPVATGSANLNPRNLDQARSGHLRLGLDSFPPAVALSLEMDGESYWSGAAGQASGSDLYVPPGKHEFRIVVSAGTGAAPISSNNAGGEFSPRKRLLMNAQIQPQPDGGVATLPRGTGISVTVQPDPFPR